MDTSFDNVLNHGKGSFQFLDPEKSISPADFKQIDLNDAQNLLELEDPVLMKHMSNSRKLLSEIIKKNEEHEFSRTRADLDKDLINQAKDASLYISNVKKITTSLSTNIENLIVQNNNLDKLHKEEVPYGFPQVTNFSKIDSAMFKKIINHIYNKVNPISDELQASNNNMVEFEKKINSLIINYNLLIGKLFDFNQTLLLQNKEMCESINKLISEDEEKTILEV